MKITIKDMTGPEIKNNGIELEVRDPDGKFRGKFNISKSKIIWREGKTSKKNGAECTWDEFIDMMGKAQRVINDSSHHVLTAEDAKLFSAALDMPPAPTPRALKAAASYRHRVANAD